jgi:hypothetical protein
LIIKQETAIKNRRKKMIDYIKTLNYITDTLTAPTVTITGLLIITLIGILLIAIPTILALYFGSEIISLFVAIYLLIFVITSLLPTGTKNVNKQVLKEQNITESINEKILTQAYNIHNIGTKSLNYINDNTNNYNNFKLSAILDHLNIKSINNLCSNVIYLDDYYTNHYQDMSKYDWINQKLNEFYKPNNTTSAATDEVLSNLKN